jgi:hypothetical protein
MPQLLHYLHVDQRTFINGTNDAKAITYNQSPDDQSDSINKKENPNINKVNSDNPFYNDKSEVRKENPRSIFLSHMMG